MSLLLNALKQRAALLKPTQTTITHADGSRTLHTSTSITKLTPGLGFIVDSAPDSSPSQLTTHLYFGSQDCCTLNILNQFNIKTVLSIGIKAPQTFENIHYLFIECLDLPETTIRDILTHSNAFISNCIQNNEKVLVHCNAGVSRSAMVVLGFLIMELGLGYEEAYLLVKKARPCIRPNVGFTKQLIQLERSSAVFGN